MRQPAGAVSPIVKMPEDRYANREQLRLGRRSNGRSYLEPHRPALLDNALDVNGLRKLCPKHRKHSHGVLYEFGAIRVNKIVFVYNRRRRLTMNFASIIGVLSIRQKS